MIVQFIDLLWTHSICGLASTLVVTSTYETLIENLEIIDINIYVL